MLKGGHAATTKLPVVGEDRSIALILTADPDNDNDSFFRHIS
jgi:hypothetical protein